MDLIEIYIEEQEELVRKIKKAREECNTGTYLNLIKALKEIGFLLKDEEIKRNISKATLYFDATYDCTMVYHGDKIYRLSGCKVIEIVDKLEEILEGYKYGSIVGDYHSVGMAIAHELISRGYRIKSMDYKVIDFNRGVSNELKIDPYETWRESRKNKNKKINTNIDISSNGCILKN